jgi:homoserine O-succinyltransferase
MPVVLEQKSPASQQGFSSHPRLVKSADQIRNSPRSSLTIGLINNMKGAAVAATERQFLSLLNSASGDICVHLRLYRLPVAASEEAAASTETGYSDIGRLWNEPLDGLIVTGREPTAACLRDEPYWDTFCQLLEWANHNTLSTIWSCLAAHAAVLQMDGIKRVPYELKRAGLFSCEVVSTHPLISGLPLQFSLPHSRWNGIVTSELVEHGYQILTQSDHAGADLFIKNSRSLFLFFQGHPEYEAETLMLEYRRDVARYLRGNSGSYPSLPRDYFPTDAIAPLLAIEHKARHSDRHQIPQELSGVLDRISIPHSWSSIATSLYRNWIQYLATLKPVISSAHDGGSYPSDNINKLLLNRATTSRGSTGQPVTSHY